MTSTIEAPVEAEAAEPVVAPMPYTVGTITIEATSEEEALRKYKRIVRAEALKAKDDMGWCESGTNERLLRLGLRERGAGVPMRVEITATRIAYLSIDADDKEEAVAQIAAGDVDVKALATASIGGGWTVSTVAATAPEEGESTYLVGAPDTWTRSTTRRCDTYGTRGYYCTLPRGHDGPVHAAGDGTTIIDVFPRT